MKRVTSCPNAVLHPWPEQELVAVLAGLPDPPPTADRSRAAWDRWQAGLKERITLPAELPPLLVLDDLAGHRTPGLVRWLFAHGVTPVYTPLGGSWLNMAESIQRILKARALDGLEPTHPDQIIDWFESVAARWNADPTPFEWGGERDARRKRQRGRRHRVGGSGGNKPAAVPQREWLRPSQMTHWPYAMRQFVRKNHDAMPAPPTPLRLATNLECFRPPTYLTHCGRVGLVRESLPPD